MIGLYASNGRMGTALQDVLKNSATPYVVYDRNDLNVFCESVDVIIDFSTPDATTQLLNTNAHCPLVIGTTGLCEKTHRLINEQCQSRPIFYAQNFSIGVYVQKKLAECAAKILDFDVEIFEAHHALKKDAPSGTAIALGQAIAQARNVNFNDVAVFHRPTDCMRKTSEIGFLSARGGGTIGDHTVHFYGPFEHVSITHNGYSRNIYAIGAIKAAQWLINKPSGLYHMDDLVADFM
ncbi:MAG: 4-hydroxy-tetrahydrodipicolinate reductase [Holosporales bacterium]